MRILVPVPWKPVVLVWGLLSTMIFGGFVASSLVRGKNPVAREPTVPRSTDARGGAHAAEQSKHSHRPAQTYGQ